MKELLEFFRGLGPIPWQDLFGDYGPTFLLGIVVAWLAQRAARARLTRRDFLHRVNFSLNDVENNQLRIRTLRGVPKRSLAVPTQTAASRIRPLRRHSRTRAS